MMYQNNSNQRIANLHYVLDELDKLYIAIQNGIITDPHQTRKQLIQSYRTQRSQFMDMLSFILPPISSPNASLMNMLPSITATSASMFPSCIDHTDNPVLIGTELNTDSTSFVSNAFHSTLSPQQNMQHISNHNHMIHLNEPGLNARDVIAPNQWNSNANNNEHDTTPPPLLHREPLNTVVTSPNHVNSIPSESVNTMNSMHPRSHHSNTNSHSKHDTLSSYQSSVMEEPSNHNHHGQYEYSDESESEHNGYGQNNYNGHNGYDYDYDYDEEDHKHSMAQNSLFLQSSSNRNDNTNSKQLIIPEPTNDYELEPGQQLVVPPKTSVAVTLSMMDLDEKTITSNKKKVIYEGKSKREKAMKAQIGHLLKFYKCGIDEKVFTTAYLNYFGYKLEIKHLPKCSSWNDFMLRCTWRKQLNGNGYIYSKYKSQYPHVYALKSMGTICSDDILTLIDIMLDSFECGVLKHHICEVFQLFYGKRLQCQGQQNEIERYLDAHFNSAHLYTFCGNICVMDKVYISSRQSSKLKQWMVTTLRKELLELFFYRSPSGIFESELAYVYRLRFKSAMCLLNMCLSEFISVHLNEYIECCETQERKTLYYFRSYLGLVHTVTKLLKSIDLSLRCKWIRDKVGAIMSLYKGGIEWKCLVKAVLSFGSFQMSQWLFTICESPPSCIQLLQENMPDLVVDVCDNMSDKICSLKSARVSFRKKKVNAAPAIDCEEICSYYDLVVLLMKDSSDKIAKTNEDDFGLFIDEIESKFNQKYDKFRLIIETPLVLNQIRGRMDEQIYDEYKRFKYDPYIYPHPQNKKNKHFGHNNYNNYKRIKDEYDEEKKIYATKWRQKEKKKVKINCKKEPRIKETIFNSASNYLHMDDICIIYGLENKKELNGISVKLMKYLRDKSKWKVMITTSAKAGTFKEISRDNLRRIVDVNTKPAFNKTNGIKPDATKIALTNLSKSTSKSHVIYKLEKTYRVGVVYCSDIIDDPYNSKGNFIAKLELQSADQISKLGDAFFIDKQLIKVHPYSYKYRKYKDILSQMVTIIIDETKNKKLSIADLYKMYKEREEEKELSLIQFCQLLEHDPTKLYIEKSMIRTIQDEKAKRNDKIAKMVINIFDRNVHIIANQWTTRSFKRKWAQEYNTNLNDAIFGKYRSYIHFLNDIQCKYKINIMNNRKKSDSSSIKFKIALK